MRNKYIEEFKRKTVALVQSGYGIRNIATKLGISPTSISHWIKDIRYMTGPTSDSELLLSQLPSGTDVPVTSELQLVKITAKEDFVPQADTRTGGVLVRCIARISPGLDNSCFLVSVFVFSFFIVVEYND